METSKVKCRECKARATQYEGALPTRGVAKVLVAGFAIYILGLWVLVALAGFTTGDAAEVGMMDMLIVLAVVVTLATAGVVWWMFRPKAGKVVICEKCGARYAVVQPPKYTNGCPSTASGSCRWGTMWGAPSCRGRASRPQGRRA